MQNIDTIRALLCKRVSIQICLQALAELEKNTVAEMPKLSVKQIPEPDPSFDPNLGVITYAHKDLIVFEGCEQLTEMNGLCEWKTDIEKSWVEITPFLQMARDSNRGVTLMQNKRKRDRKYHKDAAGAALIIRYSHGKDGIFTLGIDWKEVSTFMRKHNK